MRLYKLLKRENTLFKKNWDIYDRIVPKWQEEINLGWYKFFYWFLIASETCALWDYIEIDNISVPGGNTTHKNQFQMIKKCYGFLMVFYCFNCIVSL